MVKLKLEQIKQVRLKKIENLSKNGINPYPQPKLNHRQTCLQAQSMLDKKVVLAGRIMSLRGHGRAFFSDLDDLSGRIQLFFQESQLSKSTFDLIQKTVDVGDVVTVEGIVFKTKAGQITVDVKKFSLLAKAIRPLPEKWHGFKDTEERYRQRYLDLIVNPEVRQIFICRSKILTRLRQFLDDNGFVEVETPILQPVYGGASAKPFTTHHNTLDMDMYLRISDELYLKRLIVGGLEKVYEVSRDFRNEGVSRFHNPEFTQVEFYWAYVDYEVLMEFTEKLLVDIIKHIKGNLKIEFQGVSLDFTPPFERITFRDIILQHTGIDIDKIENEKEFKNILKTKHIKLDLTGVVGLGALFDELYKQLIRSKIIGPTFVIDYPSEMIALAKRKADNPKKIATFQLIACGTELLKAYDELNDPQDQAGRWLEEQGLEEKGLETAMQFDHDYIRALEYGMPPTAGWGMGIDRLTQFLTDQSTIKDVILFPAMRPEEADTKTKDLNKNYFVVGKIIELKPHPDADHLQIALVDTLNSQFTIVCGATNIKVGDIVPVALPGAKVYDADNKLFKIEVRKIRGIESQAMMCSSRELGVGKDDQTIKLLKKSDQKFLGQPLNLVLKLSL